MNEFLAGFYWRNGRVMTLREYADATHEFIQLLGLLHPIFRSMEWVGDRPNSAIPLAQDLSNLDELIYHHAGDKKLFLYTEANPDGSPSWTSKCKFGYAMRYETVHSASMEGLTISIRAGSSIENRVSDALTITFSLPDNARFPYPEFYDYRFLKNLFCQTIAKWKPEQGLLTRTDFAKQVVEKGPSGVGWLTYVQNPRAEALRNSPSLSGLTFEHCPEGGTLISLGPAMVSPDNAKQVEQARALRQILTAEKLIY